MHTKDFENNQQNCFFKKCQFLEFQCQDLISQTSSPLSQSDSCTGRSADLLLPLEDAGKKRHENLHDIASYPRAEKFRTQVRRIWALSILLIIYLWRVLYTLRSSRKPKTVILQSNNLHKKKCPVLQYLYQFLWLENVAITSRYSL